MRLYRNLGATAATFEGHGEGTGKGLLHYQFGRSVPHAGKLGTMTTESSQQNFAYVVKNPMTYITAGTANWSTQDTSTAYMWLDKNVEAASDGKSIFDPSPIGWRVPIHGAFSDFPANATAAVDNVVTYTLGTTGTANYYTTGYRLESTSGLAAIGSQIRTWMSTPSTTSRAYYLLYVNSAVQSSATYYHAQGYTIRAVRE